MVEAAETDIPSVDQLMKEKIEQLKQLAGAQTSGYIRMPNQPDRTPKLTNWWLILLIVVVLLALNVQQIRKLFRI
ncbi:hypothetical protein EBT31_05335 [bacterium]|nr:hypothetical protein [bacterium]NBX49809.1 hypothetical protein [bacterium]